MIFRLQFAYSRLNYFWVNDVIVGAYAGVQYVCLRMEEVGDF